MSSELLLFFVFAGVTVLGSLIVIGQKNPIYGVLALIFAFFGLSGLYVLLEAPFVAIVQVIIYAGAIMVLFLFVVMLLNVPREDAAEWDRAHPLYRPGPMRIGAALALLMVGQVVWALMRSPNISQGVGAERPGISDVGVLGQKLFTDYMFAFEVTSILIIAAMIGAVVLARKQDR